ncbi:hypothetical protein [Priestia abyssalis]|uniref:hypothetical protein n=1 Tax=Priestia abyssalis TaxID=1221450 RepID=UPI0009951DA7|nr:hypothetical protein [Priestia abyssalis]
MKQELSIQELCQDLEKEELIQLVTHLSDEYADIDMAIMEWYASQKGLNKSSTLPNKLLWEYWERAEEIISDFNDYGGGPEHLEYEAAEYLEKIRELSLQSTLSLEEKRTLMNRAFSQYAIGNSGFDDALIDFIYELCDSNSDWEHVIKLLKTEPRSWNEKLIMGIYKNQLHDDEAYLERRLQTLEYGMDYWDLVGYYVSKCEVSKAVEVAQSGMEKGKGRITELVLFLFDYYEKQKDDRQIDALIEQSFQRNEEITLVGERAFDYFKQQGDYEKAKNQLLRMFRTSYFRKKHYEYYKVLKNYLTAEDWDEVKGELLQIAKKENVTDYMTICYEEENYDEVLNIILQQERRPYGYGYMQPSWDRFADKLAERYPRQISEYYWNKGCSFIPDGNRKTYKEAAKYLQKVRNIYQNLLTESDVWQSRLAALKMQHKNKRAFLDEIRVVEH